MLTKRPARAAAAKPGARSPALPAPRHPPAPPRPARRRGACARRAAAAPSAHRRLARPLVLRLVLLLVDGRAVALELGAEAADLRKERLRASSTIVPAAWRRRRRRSPHLPRRQPRQSQRAWWRRARRRGCERRRVRVGEGCATVQRCAGSQQSIPPSSCSASSDASG